jgi:aminoglycoside 3-N-acetyltransferase
MPISSLNQFLRTSGRSLYGETSGSRMLRDVRSICKSDRWNSFDRFHDTTEFLTSAYSKAGAATEVFPIRTGGESGTGQWIIREASDIRSATVDVIAPVRLRVLDYEKNPWHVIQWSAATPPGGLRSELVIVDSEDDLSRYGRTLEGKTVLTRMNPKGLLGRLTAAGALAVISDRGIEDLPDATAWMKFGWGAIPLSEAGARLVGLVLSRSKGQNLRDLHSKHAGKLTLHLNVDVRPYIGDHDLVSGIVKGGQAPQEELWVLAHSAEPGAIDNASGVATCIEAARTIESAIAKGRIERPKRSIRFLSGFECYSFFNYMEFARRYQTPLAGLCVDTVGAKPEVCDRQFSWRATIPMSATFVDRIGETVARSVIRQTRPGYRLVTGPFVSTSDTLAGDPKYGFPCPWISTHYRKGGNTWKAYHSSADTPALLSTSGLATAALTTASYLVYLANAGNRELTEIAASETLRTTDILRRSRHPDKAEFAREQHHRTIERLKRWTWGGSPKEIQSELDALETEVRKTGPKPRRRTRTQNPLARVPRRTRPITPTLENTREPIASKIRASSLPNWALFWADDRRSITEITRLIAQEIGREVSPQDVAAFFEAHAELGYADMVDAADVLSKADLTASLRALGVTSGMTVMVHSSLSAIGHVADGANGVVDALLSAVGKRGNLVMPSFNHRAAGVYNPATSPTTNGAIPDAFWRRSGAMRSNHPTHAVAAHGPLAAEFVRDHVEGGIWTEHDPIARVIRANGYILSLGVTHTSSTAYHVAELSMPCGCIDPFGSRDRIVDESGNIRVVDSLAWRDGQCPISPAKLDETLSRNKHQTTGKVGSADATLVPARLVYETRRRHLRDACPTCTIKPKAQR